MNMEYITHSADETAALLAKYNLVETVVTSVATLPEPEHVWDVSLLNDDIPVPHSIFTNGLVTHNSCDPTYFENMINASGTTTKIQDVFGSRDASGNWAIAPRARLYNESVAETFFDSMASLFRQLPDKIYMDGQWYYVYENTKINRAICGGKFDKKLFTEFNKFYVPSPDGHPQAIIFLDSYPMMFPDKLDEDNKGAGMAATARMFSENIPKIAAKLKKKAVTIIGVNQLRLRPGVSYGCYHGSVKVTMADGSQYPIKQVVDEKMVGPVLALNPSTKKFEAKPITAWFNNGPAESWLHITYEVDKSKKGNRTASIVVTPEHLMWSNDYDTLMAASLFNEGNTFLAPTDNVLSEHARQLYLGMMLGDGWFTTDGDYVKMSYGHKGEHSWYVDWKRSLLPKGPGNVSGEEFITHQLPYVHSPELSALAQGRKLGCEGREKRITSEFAHALGTLGLAVWYMDDVGKKRLAPAPPPEPYPLFNMQSYPLKDVRLLCRVLNDKYDADCVVVTWTDNASDNNLGHGIRLDSKVMSLIAPYVHRNFIPVVTDSPVSNAKALGYLEEGMLHLNPVPKYTSLFGEFKGWVGCSDVGSVPVVISSIEKIDNPAYHRSVNINGKVTSVGGSNRYEIEVKDFGLFVADGVAGKNSPEYEPAGETVKFVSSCRIRQARRAVPHASGQIEEEDSVTSQGNVDTYSYVHMKTIKNKTGTPFLESWQRIWVKDADGIAHGFCPVYDCFQYLKNTGQCKGTMKKLTITMDDGTTLEKISFIDLKALILLKGKALKEYASYLGLTSNPKIRDKCFQQIKDGVGAKLFFDNLKKVADEEEDTGGDEGGEE